MPDPLGQAISDYFFRRPVAKLWIHNKYGEKEEMPVDLYFRTFDEMPLLEQLAMNYCQGSVLDIGAGAGSHALYLQDRSLAVSALEISPLSCEVMEQRGVQRIINQDIRTYSADRYDTLLMLMNGIGLSETLSGLKQFLTHAALLLKPGGQLLFDSSNVAYLYEEEVPQGRYYGEIDYQYSYRKEETDWFTWLYVDHQTLFQLASAAGWRCELLMEDEHHQYLVRLTREADTAHKI